MIEDGLAQRRPEAPRYTRPYPPEIDRTPLRRNYRLPEFTLFSGDGHTSSIEHIGRFTAQCGEADSDAHKLRLFVHSLTGAVFSWFINLPPNSMRDWSDMERTFHEHFYQTNREITVAELARMGQAADESPRDYLQRLVNISLGRALRVPRPRPERLLERPRESCLRVFPSLWGNRKQRLVAFFESMIKATAEKRTLRSQWPRFIRHKQKAVIY